MIANEPSGIDRTSIKNVGRDSLLLHAGLATISGVSIQLALVLTGIAYTRSLPVNDRGYLALLVLYPTILFQVVALGVPAAVAFFGASDMGAGHTSGRTILRVASTQAAVCVSVHAVVLMLYLPHVPSTIYRAALLSLAIGPLYLSNEYGVAALQSARRYTLVNVCRPLPTVVSVPAALAAWFVFPGQILAVVAAIVFGLVVGSVFTTLEASFAYRQMGPSADNRGAPTKALLSYGSRSYLASLYPIDAFRIDQLLLAAWTTPATLAVYAVASSFTNLPRFLAQSIGYISLPAVAASHERQRGRLQLRIVAVVAVAIALLSIPILILMPALVILFFGGAYRTAGSTARLLLVAAVLVAVRRVAVDSLKGSARMWPGILAEGATWLTLASLARVSVSTYGANGMALCLVAAYLLGLVVLTVASLRRPGGRSSLSPPHQ